MVPTVPGLVIVVLSVLLFLVAAKVHGRELRLEREAAGFHDVTFGSGTNPPAVEALWADERTRFSIGSAVAVVVALALCAWQRPSAAVWASALLSWAPSLSFLVCGALSFLRRG